MDLLLETYPYDWTIEKILSNKKLAKTMRWVIAAVFKHEVRRSDPPRVPTGTFGSRN